MRTEVYICDNCNADITEHVSKFGTWQTWQAHGRSSAGEYVSVDACSLDCLIACLASKAISPTT